MKKLLLLFTALAYLQCLHAQNWNEKLKAVASDRAANNWFGWSVAVSGNYAIIGVCKNSTNAVGGDTLLGAGAAYMFERDSIGNWIQKQKIVASDRVAGNRFGVSVSISDNYAIVGSLGSILEANSAYIFKRDTLGIWTQKQKITSSDSLHGFRFGVSVSISDNYAIVGDPTQTIKSFEEGAAYLYERDSSDTWMQKQKIVAADTSWGGAFGQSISISGNYAIVGSTLRPHGGAGSVYIFERDMGIWKQKQKIVSPNNSYPFAVSLSISGNYAIVGGDTYPYIFERDSLGLWISKQMLSSTHTGGIGPSVSISGNRAIVGYGLDSTNAIGKDTIPKAGATYLFERDSNGNWIQQQKLIASDRTKGANFGGSLPAIFYITSVAISGDHVLVGANWNYTNSVGGDSLYRAGAAYFFEPCVPVTSSQTLTACAGQSVTVGTNTYTASGTYTDTLTAVNTCDSIVTTNLTVNQPPQAGFFDGFSMCDGTHWEFIDTSVSASGDSIVTWSWHFAGASPSDTIPQYTGSIVYVIFPSYSTFTVCLTVTSLHGCKDSICQVIYVIPQSINKMEMESYTSIFPNPTSGEIEIISGISDVNSVEIYNLLGERVYSGVWSDISNQLQSTTTLSRLAGDSVQVQNIMCRTASGSSQLQTKTNNEPQIMSVDLRSQPNGIYFLQLKTSEGVTTKKIVIEK